MHLQRVEEGNAGRVDEIGAHAVRSFSKALHQHQLELRKDRTQTLQINVGLLCNQACRHGHLEAGPHRVEVMSQDTMVEVAAYASLARFQVVDITGGATEMNPHLGYLIETISPLVPRLMVRSNLTALAKQETQHFLKLFKKHQVVIVASLPSINRSQADSVRGNGVWESSIAMLKELNKLGYGKAGTGLELNLVSNPTGAFLPACQSQMEARVRRDLEQKWDITFNSLFTFANTPVGRFRFWLKESGNLEEYMEKLRASFNPVAVQRVMCRNLLSVSWDGFLFDCDFNLARGLYFSGRKRHVSEMEVLPEPGTEIPTGDHCFACVAGAGFT